MPVVEFVAFPRERYAAIWIALLVLDHMPHRCARFMMLMENEPNIREVIAFAKTGEGRDLMMDSPAEVDLEQLMELGITVKPKKK